jgi:hypothetical protein
MYTITLKLECELCSATAHVTEKDIAGSTYGWLVGVAPPRGWEVTEHMILCPVHSREVAAKEAADRAATETEETD